MCKFDSSIALKFQKKKLEQLKSSKLPDDVLEAIAKKKTNASINEEETVSNTNEEKDEESTEEKGANEEESNVSGEESLSDEENDSLLGKSETLTLQLVLNQFIYLNIDLPMMADMRSNEEESIFYILSGSIECEEATEEFLSLDTYVTSKLILNIMICYGNVEL